MSAYIKKNSRYRRQGLGRQLQNLGLSGKILLVMALVFFLFVCAGSIMANRLDQGKYDHILGYVDSFGPAADSANDERTGLFRESFLKYGKTVLLIWIVSFVPIGGVFALLTLGAKGMSLGFTTSLFILRYGGMGLLFSGILYLPQSIILLSGYFFVTYYSIRFALQNFGQEDNRQQEGELWGHLMILVIGLLCTITVAAYEAYILPSMITIFFM